MIKRNLVLLLVCAVLLGGGSAIANWLLPLYYYHALFATFGLCLLVVTLFGKDTINANITR